jgi:hypothetical protein
MINRDAACHDTVSKALLLLLALNFVFFAVLPTSSAELYSV